MAKTMYVLLLMVLTLIGVWPQQAIPQTQPPKDETKSVQAAQDNAPPLSEKDQFLVCPAGTEQRTERSGLYKAGGNVTPPKPTRQVNATFSDEARKMARKMHLKSFQAVSLVTLIVDSQGNPQGVCVQKPAGFGLDGQAVKAVKQYRFEPATKDGSPVPVRIFVEVNFRLY